MKTGYLQFCSVENRVTKDHSIFQKTAMKKLGEIDTKEINAVLEERLGQAVKNYENLLLQQQKDNERLTALLAQQELQQQKYQKTRDEALKQQEERLAVIAKNSS